MWLYYYTWDPCPINHNEKEKKFKKEVKDEREREKEKRREGKEEGSSKGSSKGVSLYFISCVFSHNCCLC